MLSLMLIMLVSGCVTVSHEALCDGTKRDRADLALALSHSDDDAAVVAGANLIRKLDRGCAK